MAAFVLETLPVELQDEVVERLDRLALSLFAVTSKKFYEKYNDRMECAANLVVLACQTNALDVLDFFLDLGCLFTNSRYLHVRSLPLKTASLALISKIQSDGNRAMSEYFCEDVFFYCIQCGRKDIVRWVLEHVGLRISSSVVSRLGMRNWLDIVQIIVEKGVTIDMNVLLMAALRCGNVETATYAYEKRTWNGNLYPIRGAILSNGSLPVLRWAENNQMGSFKDEIEKATSSSSAGSAVHRLCQLYGPEEAIPSKHWVVITDSNYLPQYFPEVTLNFPKLTDESEIERIFANVEKRSEEIPSETEQIPVRSNFYAITLSMPEFRKEYDSFDKETENKFVLEAILADSVPRLKWLHSKGYGIFFQKALLKKAIEEGRLRVVEYFLSIIALNNIDLVLYPFIIYALEKHQFRIAKLLVNTFRVKMSDVALPHDHQTSAAKAWKKNLTNY